MTTTEFQILVEMEGPNKAKVSIGANPSPPPLAALMVATEHMMNAMAMHGDDYEKSLALLCDGARKSRATQLGGKGLQ